MQQPRLQRSQNDFLSLFDRVPFFGVVEIHGLNRRRLEDAGRFEINGLVHRDDFEPGYFDVVLYLPGALVPCWRIQNRSGPHFT